MMITKYIKFVFLTLALWYALPVCADNAPQSSIKVKGSWFATGLYSLNIANNGMTYSRIGVMGGYLKNWGGYAKVDFALNGNRTPNASAGFTKRLATFSNITIPSTLHFYFGLGYANVQHGSDQTDHEHITKPDGTTECVPGTEHTSRYWDSCAGLLAETGLIFRYQHINFNLGYSIGADIVSAAYGSGDTPNHAIQIGIGYTF